MAAVFSHHTGSHYVEILLTGKVTHQDFEAFAPEIERLVREHGKLRMLVELQDFHGWTLRGLWEDIKFDAQHFNDIERLAIVGEKTWHSAMAMFCKPFTTAKVRYFDVADVDMARAWIADGSVRSREPAEAAESHVAAT